VKDRPLPLFPLPLVLYPGAVVPLHIFEPRYRRMLGYCLEFDRRFGLIFHDPDLSGPFLNEPGRVGCVAEVQRVEILDDGRSLILTKGRERFRIVREVEDAGTPYFQARVEAVPDTSRSSEGLVARRRASLELFHSVLRRVEDELPAVPDFDVNEELSYRLAATVDTHAGWHQELLELTDELDRLERVDPVFRAALLTLRSNEINGT